MHHHVPMSEWMPLECPGCRFRFLPLDMPAPCEECECGDKKEIERRGGVKKLGIFFYFIAIAVILWTVFTCMIYRFENPTKTETEVFLHIPYSFILRMDN
jgi:hypothetical protein